jgi:hypothetical protein
MLPADHDAVAVALRAEGDVRVDLGEPADAGDPEASE